MKRLKNSNQELSSVQRNRETLYHPYFGGEMRTKELYNVVEYIEEERKIPVMKGEVGRQYCGSRII